jgi:glycosyltransferase involved in cell wall biosynthesis
MTLISVVTPTWKRHQLLLDRCIPSVQAQTWPEVEHVIVSDGPDTPLEKYLHRELVPEVKHRIVYGHAPVHDDSPHNWGSAARNHAAKLVAGDLVAYLDDDNAYRPDHLALLAKELLANPQADFAYSQMLTHPHERIVGAVPPTYGHIDTSLLMHRADTLDKYGDWPLAGQIEHSDQHAPDWGVVAKWLDGGAKWVHVPQVTVDYWAG